MGDEIRRNMALFSMGSVMKLTELTARQIRYYEQHELIAPARTSGKQRLFSFNDVERLLTIKSLIEKGVNIAGIKQVLAPAPRESDDATVVTDQSEAKRRELGKELDDKDVHKSIKQQIMSGDRYRKPTLIEGELSRFNLP